MANNDWTVDSNEALVLSLGQWQAIARTVRKEPRHYSARTTR